MWASLRATLSQGRAANSVKIGIYSDHLLSWQGGRDLLCMLLDSLNDVCGPGDDIQIVSIRRRDTNIWKGARLAKHFLTRFPPDLRWAEREISRPVRSQVIAELVGGRFAVKYLSDFTAGAPILPDVLGLWHGPKPNVSIPCVGYIPDCQHRQFANFFSSEEISGRDHLFAEMRREFSVIVVNSEDAKADLTRFFRMLRAKL